MTSNNHVQGIHPWSDVATSHAPEQLEAAERLLASCGADEEAGACLLALRTWLGDIPRPERALVGLQRLLSAHPEPEALAASLAGEPRLLHNLLTLFVGSQYLSEILLGEPAMAEELADLSRLARPYGSQELYRGAMSAANGAADMPALAERLCAFQRQHLLRIGLCDLAGLLDVSTVTQQLSVLADVLIQVALDRAADRCCVDPGGFCVLAMGKLGGGELNYSSDIDLLFVADGQVDRYQRLGERIIEILTLPTGRGFLYRVDMRLRPWGQAGPLVTSRAGYLRYLAQSARLWEKQALLKARCVAGDQGLGARLLEEATPYIYAVEREAARRDVRGMKERIEQELHRRGRAWGEVKLGVGSIRDVEFVTQYLQLLHGADHSEVRSRNTLGSLARLFQAGLLPQGDYQILSEGYVFLRPVEHLLQIMNDQQTHSLPSDAAEIAYLGRRLGFQGPDAGEQFLTRYAEHGLAIRAVYDRYLGETPMSEGSPGQAQPAGVSRLAHHLERMVPAYAEAFTPEEVAQHALMADRLTRAHQVDVLAQPLPEGAWRVTVVGYDYPGVLSLICGLLFVHGFTIRSGHVFTYEPLSGPGEEPAAEVGRRSAGPERRKIVDAFTVYPVRGTATEATWLAYANELADYVTLTARYQAAEARGDLAKRVAAALNETPSRSEALHPIDIEIDNQVSASYTVLWLSTEDTPGFLYEFTNALALSAIEISRVVVASEGNRVRDAFYLTDRRGQKITSPQAERELRAATVLVKHFTHLLPLSPNPESALLHFREFLEQLFARPDWPDELASLERREVLAALARLLGVSDFLWEDFMRMQYANLFPVVRDVDDLAFGRAPEELRAMLAAELDGAADYDEARERLNAFKDRETFRVDMRHIQGHLPEFGQFSAELSDVVEAVVEAAYALCYRTLVSQYGAPMSAEGAPGALTVCVLGKLGGREIGYASDIELMFIYDDNGMTAGPQAVSSADFWNRLVTLFLETIRARREGIFDIDLRLRPYGSAGSLAVPLASFRRYFGPGGPAWDYERQAIVKLRPLCGDAALGAKIASLRDAFVFAGQAPDIAAMRAMRERQMRHLVSAGTINCKFSPGGLVDIEYLVQSMQRRYGHEHSDVRVPNTRLALRALFDADLISQDDYAALAAALGFMRDLIDALRVERGNARDLTVPPVGSEAMAFLARRLGYGDEGEQLYADVLAHSREVQARSERLLATL